MSEENNPSQSYSFEEFKNEAKLRQIEQLILLKLPKISAIEITMADKETLTIKATSEYTDEELAAEIEKVLQKIKQFSKDAPIINYTPGTLSKELVDKALKEYKGSPTFIMGDEMRDEVHGRIIDEMSKPTQDIGELLNRLKLEFHSMYELCPEGETQEGYKERCLKGQGYIHAITRIEELINQRK